MFVENGAFQSTQTAPVPTPLFDDLRFLCAPFAEQDQALLVIIYARVRDVGGACGNCVISVLVEQWRVAWQGQRVTLGTEQSSFCHQACIHRVPRRSSASSSPNHCLSRALRRRLHLSPPITNKELFFSSRVSKRYLSVKSLFHVNNCAAFLCDTSLSHHANKHDQNESPHARYKLHT